MAQNFVLNLSDFLKKKKKKENSLEIYKIQTPIEDTTIPIFSFEQVVGQSELNNVIIVFSIYHANYNIS